MTSDQPWDLPLLCPLERSKDVPVGSSFDPQWRNALRLFSEKVSGRVFLGVLMDS